MLDETIFRGKLNLFFGKKKHQTQSLFLLIFPYFFCLKTHLLLLLFQYLALLKATLIINEKQFLNYQNLAQYFSLLQMNLTLCQILNSNLYLFFFILIPNFFKQFIVDLMSSDSRTFFTVEMF